MFYTFPVVERVYPVLANKTSQPLCFCIFQMELAHAREITALRTLVEDERNRARETSTRFEDELERKFAMLAEGLEEQAREYHKHRLERALGGLEHQAMSEVDQTRVRNEGE